MGHFSYFNCTSALESPIQADLILLSFSLLHFADTVGVFVCLFVCLQIEGLWQPCIEQVISTIFPTAFAYSAVQAVSLLLSLLQLSMISDL